MTSLTLDHITDLVALRLGEFPDNRIIPAGGTAQTSLGEMVKVRLEDAARQLTRAAPLDSFSVASDLRPFLANAAMSADGSRATVDLPDDFCRLRAFRVEGWGVTLDEDFTGDPLRASLCETVPAWLRNRPGRPWIRIHGEGATLRLSYGPVSASAFSEAAYIPLPVYDAALQSLIGFDPALQNDLITLLADELGVPNG